MEAKPDAGDIVGQVAVPIGPDEDATAVFAKVSNAAIEVMQAALPELLQGRVPRTPNLLANGSYFGGRKPEDGRIQWSQDALQVHNLIRAVAPPYPGAFTDWQGARMVIAKSKLNPALFFGSAARVLKDHLLRVGHTECRALGKGQQHCQTKYFHAGHRHALLLVQSECRHPKEP